MTAQEAANLRSARSIAIARAGLSISVDQTPSLEYADRVKYLKELAAVILAYPARFDEQTVAAARDVQAANYGTLEKYTVSEAISDAAGAAADAVRAANPLDSSNVAAFGRNLLIALTILGAFWLFLRNGPPPSAARARAA